MKDHLKRMAAPNSWQITRKNRKWLVRSNPGAHKTTRSVPLAVLLRDMLGQANNIREVKNILTKKQVIVNGLRVKDHKLPVGLMDVVSFPDSGEYFRILINHKGKIYAKKIEKKTDAEVKMFKIKNKNLVKNKVQLNLSSGNNLLVDKDVYKTGDSLLLSIGKDGKKEIKNHLKLDKGCVVYLTGGAHIGEMGEIDSISGNKIIVKINGEPFETLKKYAFVIGKEKPLIEI